VFFGRRAFFPSAVEELPADYRRVIDHLRQRYVATYISTNSNRDGKWREVEIQTPEYLRVKSRGGYQAPDGK
jgi:hypothetical protein